MQFWLKGLLMSVLAFGASWLGAIAYWRNTNRMPATGELATYLVALPLALLLGYWALTKGAAIWQARGKPATPAPDAGPDAAAPAAIATPAPVLHIVAAALRTPHGESATELSGALAAHTARADLDLQLQDDDGYPVMCARAMYVDEAAMEDAVRQWLSEAAQPPLSAQPEFWRALALVTPVASELAMAAASHDALASAPENNRRATQQAIPMLQLALVLPAEWPAAWRNVAAEWLTAQTVAMGWPRRHCAVTVYADTAPTLLTAMHGGGLPCFTLLLACASHLGGQTVARWAERHTLFTARQPQGLMPGEAAAGLLLASGVHAARLAAGPVAQLAAIHTGAGDGGALPQLAQAACQAAEPHAAPALIVADTGHRNGRIMELMAAAHGLLPQLDPTEHVATLGSATGHAAAAAALAALALAVHEAQARNAPVLCLTNEDPQQRSAALILPAAYATPGNDL
jgi:hypothetical protein